MIHKTDDLLSILSNQLKRTEGNRPRIGYTPQGVPVFVNRKSKYEPPVINCDSSICATAYRKAHYFQIQSDAFLVAARERIPYHINYTDEQLQAKKQHLETMAKLWEELYQR